MRRIGPAVIASVLLAGCGTTSVVAQDGEPAPTVSATPTPSPTAPDGLSAADIAAIYGAVLRRYGGWRGAGILVEDSPATARDDRLWRSPRAEPFDDATRAAIAKRVGPALRWIADSVDVPRTANGLGVRGGTIAVVGPIHGTGDRVRVAINTYCGGRCGRIYMHAVARVGGVWKLAGSGYECTDGKCPGGIVY